MTTKPTIAKLMSATALVAIISVPALAADMPVKAPPRPATPQLWSGFYIGAHVGGARARDRYETTVFPGPVFQSPANLAAFNAAGSGHGRDTGIIGGAQIGYNWRSGTLVYGLEADISGLWNEPELVRTAPLPIGPFAGTPFTVATATRTDWLMTFRPRAGIAVDNALLYVTGGGAIMQVRRDASFVSQTPIPDIGSGNERRLLPGWAIGGGIEYAFGGNWSAKVEYLYARFAESTLGYSLDFAGNNNPNAVRVREQLSLQMARFGLNYHFGDARSATAPAFYAKAPQALVYTWSGIYVGAHAGWARTRADFDADVFPGVFVAPPNLALFSAAKTGRVHSDGFAGGGQIGANAQFNRIVIGLEADISYGGAKATLSRTGPIAPAPSTFTATATAEVDWLATLRARLGFAFDRSLVYVTAGGAVARIQTAGSFVDTTPAPSDSGAGSRTDTVGGWVVGGGFEYAFSQSWSLKAEYLHVELSRGLADFEISFPGNVGLTNPVYVNNDITLRTARIGLNYKFASGTK